MVTNAHAGVENSDPEIRRMLNWHHEQLCDALCAALDTARAHQQQQSGTDTRAAAELLTSLMYTQPHLRKARRDVPKATSQHEL